MGRPRKCNMPPAPDNTAYAAQKLLGKVAPLTPTMQGSGRDVEDRFRYETILTLVEPVYEQQAGELVEDYTLFTWFLGLGPARSLLTLHDVLVKGQTEAIRALTNREPSEEVVRRLSARASIIKLRPLAAAMRWNDRAFAYDHENTQLDLKKWQVYQNNLRSQEWLMAQDLLALAARSLKLMLDGGTVLTFDQVLDAMMAASKLGRLATGLSPDGRTSPMAAVVNQINGNVVQSFTENPDPILAQLDARMRQLQQEADDLSSTPVPASAPPLTLEGT